MGSTSFLNKSKTKSGSSIGSDKEMNGKLRRTKIRRPTKMNEYGLKRIPDYTELAYKEAVGKLRYFLSGNYTPSVRSYGGSTSIKNLDESDGDLDKKYTPYNALSEYRPRPKLTAKYATLYADSLNNTSPFKNLTNTTPLLTSGSAASGADLSGGANPDVVNFIQKQEEYIEQLERESQYCRDELNNLLGKVKEVISENEHLHEAQKNKLISRMFHSYNAGSETDELDDIGESTGLDSDNKVTPSKNRKSSKTRSTRLEGPNIIFESRIAELEAQLAQAKIDLKKIQDENNENKRKMASGLVDSTCLDGFKRQIDNLQRDKSALEAQISKLKLNLEQKEDGIYKRSDAIEQQLRDERNNLEGEVRRLKDELAKERSKVRDLAGEGARRAMQERSAAEQRYNTHFDELQNDLAAQYDNVAKLQLELERHRRDENDLKRELSMKNSAIEELKTELKNKTASLQADLSQAYAEKAALEEELASLRLAIERHQRQAKHETNRLNSEIQSLRQRLDRADADLVHSRRENLRLSEQIAALEKEINMKNLSPISPEKKKKENELSTMFESMENKHAKTVAELESMIQSQNSLMEKLTGECRLLTDKLEDANRRHKEELATLQRQIEQLGDTLQPKHMTLSNQQAPTAYTPTTHGVSSHKDSTRSDYTRDDPTRNTTGDQPVRDFRSNREHSNVHESKKPLENSKDVSFNNFEETQSTDELSKFNDDYTNETVEENENNENVILDNAHNLKNLPQTYEEREYDNHHQPFSEQDNTNVEYQSQEYDPNHHQSDYNQSEYENYEQYPQYNESVNAPNQENYENNYNIAESNYDNYKNTQDNSEHLQYVENDTAQEYTSEYEQQEVSPEYSADNAQNLEEKYSNDIPEIKKSDSSIKNDPDNS